MEAAAVVADEVPGDGIDLAVAGAPAAPPVVGEPESLPGGEEAIVVAAAAEAGPGPAAVPGTTLSSAVATPLAGAIAPAVDAAELLPPKGARGSPSGDWGEAGAVAPANAPPPVQSAPGSEPPAVVGMVPLQGSLRPPSALAALASGLAASLAGTAAAAAAAVVAAAAVASPPPQVGHPMANCVGVSLAGVLCAPTTPEAAPTAGEAEGARQWGPLHGKPHAPLPAKCRVKPLPAQVQALFERLWRQWGPLVRVRSRRPPPRPRRCRGSLAQSGVSWAVVAPATWAGAPPPRTPAKSTWVDELAECTARM